MTRCNESILHQRPDDLAMQIDAIRLPRSHHKVPWHRQFTTTQVESLDGDVGSGTISALGDPNSYLTGPHIVGLTETTFLHPVVCAALRIARHGLPNLALVLKRS